MIAFKLYHRTKKKFYSPGGTSYNRWTAKGKLLSLNAVAQILSQSTELRRGQMDLEIYAFDVTPRLGAISYDEARRLARKHR